MCEAGEGVKCVMFVRCEVCEVSEGVDYVRLVRA